MLTNGCAYQSATERISFQVETTWKAFAVNCQDNQYKRCKGVRLCTGTHMNLALTFVEWIAKGLSVDERTKQPRFSIEE